MNLEKINDFRNQLFPEVNKQFGDFHNLMVKNRYWSKLRRSVMIVVDSVDSVETSVEHKLKDYEFICNRTQTASR